MILKNGDCIKEMQKLIDDGVQVDSVVTDPPYELGFMGRSWDSTGIAFQKETWELAYKLLKPGGHLLAFSASRNYHRMAVAIEDAGFEIRDQMMWLYGSGFPKSLNLGNGWGTALKPAHEPIVMARKLLEGTNKQNMEKYGVGGINIDGCRVEGEVKHPPNNPDFRDAAKQAMAKGGVDKLSFGQDRDAPIKRKTTNRKSRSKDGVWTDGNSGMKAEGSQFADADPKGRFPANVMHGGLETEWAKYFYCPKVSKSERNQGLEDFPVKKSKGGGGTSNDTWYEDDVNSASGKFGSEKAPSKNTHPTVKPQELMKYLCRMVTPKGGTVLDIFMGSGSTGMAAKDEGFDFIGIERDKEYFNIAEKRIKITAPLSEFME